MDQRSLLRLFLLQSVVVAAVLTLLARLWFLQVGAGEDYAAAAQSQREREVVTAAARGQVLDDLGRSLVRNRLSLVVTVDRHDLRAQDDDGAAVLDRLSSLLGMPVPELEQRITPCGDGAPEPCWNGSPYQPVAVADDVPPEVALHLAEHAEDFPGVQASPEPVREYPLGTTAAHSLGYLAPASPEQILEDGLRGRDLVGAAGLEQVYDEQLRGEDGVRRLAVDSSGVVVGTVGEDPPDPGAHLVLSLDAGIQQVAEEALAAGIERARARTDRLTGEPLVADAGAVVVLEAATGRVVALANYPAYDPTVWVGGISPEDYAALTAEGSGDPLIPRAWQGQYAPASTFKIISTIAGVEGGASLDGTYACPGSLRIGNRPFRNFDSIPLGRITLHTALVKSCDTTYYQFAYDAWQRDGGIDPEGRGVEPLETFVRVAQRFGLGSPTGVDLPSEAAGRVADRDFYRERWEQMHETWCSDAEAGYPDVAATDPERAAYLTQIASENCVDGMNYRAGDAVNFSIGQGDTVVTPLQLAVVYAALANGGTVHEPRLAKAVVSADGEVLEEITPPVAGTVDVDPEVLAYIRNALGEVPSDGTARGAFADFPLDQFPIAGKTGTAQVANKQDTSWFASFAPVEDPQYVVVAMVSQGGTGGTVAAPIVADVYKGIYGVGRPAARPCDGAREVPLPQLSADGSVVPPCPVPEQTPPLDAPPPADVVAEEPLAPDAVVARREAEADDGSGSAP